MVMLEKKCIAWTAAHRQWMLAAENQGSVAVHHSELKAVL